MNLWLMMVIAGVITYLIRLSFILLFNHQQLPLVLQRALRFVPPAVLTAIFVPEMLYVNGTLAITPLNPRLLAGLLAILVAWLSKNIFLTIVAGMITLWIFEALL
jgi:branched-subunit amino acid transport protein